MFSKEDNMGLIALLNESRAQVWESWGWLSFALFLAISVGRLVKITSKAD